MSEENDRQVSKRPSMCEEMMSRMAGGDSPMESCPMSEGFKRVSGKRGFGMLAMIPGLLFLLIGVAIIVEPQILAWLIAAASIVVGVAMLVAANFFRKLAGETRI